MNEAWTKHIQPILDSSRHDNFNWIWDPFLIQFPKFRSEQRTQVEDALETCAFDYSDEELAIKALGIAEILHRSKLTSKKFSKHMRDGLRKYAHTSHIDQVSSKYYIFAFSTFEVKEAIPYIKSVMRPLQEGWPENPIYLNERNHQELFRACCISLLRLGESEAKSFLALFIENDLRMTAIGADRAMWGLTDLGNFWDQFGIRGFRKLTAGVQVWQKENLVSVLPQLKQTTERIHYRSDREKQEVIKLIGDLENRITES
jgi:hypothetical protein